jgi:peptidoglycan hydrolase CwlO-like protein
MESVPTWGLFFLGAASVVVAVIAGKYSSRLLTGKGIKEIVESANAIIEMYEKHVGALELEVSSLKREVANLTSKLDETLTQNAALQKLLLASPAVTLPPEVGKSE